jgi:heat shock protein HtpX
MGYVKTAILLAAMTALFMGFGLLLGRTGGGADRLCHCGGHECLCLLEL